MADYEVFLLSPGGTRQKVLSDYIDLSVVLSANDVSVARVLLRGAKHSRADFDRDSRLEIERNRQSIGGAPFFVRLREMQIARGGARLLSLSAFHANHLLKRRNIAYYSGSSRALASTEACDDLMKRLVRFNLGSSAQTGPHVAGVADNLRDYPAPDLSSFFAVASDMAEASTTSREFARRYLLNTLQDIAADSYAQSRPLFFGIEKNNSGVLEFITRVNQWGTDRTSQEVVSPNRGNLTDVRLVDDWTEEVTVGYALGTEEGENRAVAVSLADDREGSPFNWIEGYTDARNISTAASLQAEADAYVKAHQGKQIFSGKLQDIPSFRFKTHWDWGDKLPVEVEGVRTNAWLNRVSIRYQNGDEDIDAQIEAVL